MFKDYYFSPLTGLEPSAEVDYKELDRYIQNIIDIGDISSKAFYCIDYMKKKFYFPFNDPLVLCGYSMEDANSLGCGFLEKIIPGCDLKILCEVNQKWFEFYYQLPEEKRRHCNLSFDIRMTHRNGYYAVMKHNLKPVLLTPEGKIWISLCHVEKSKFNHSGNIMISLSENESYLYSVTTKIFKLRNQKPLTQREKDVKELMDMGLTKTNIADSLSIKPDTVKYHKKNISSKQNSHLRDVG